MYPGHGPRSTAGLGHGMQGADRPAARPVPLGVVMARKRLIAWQLKLGEF